MKTLLVAGLVLAGGLVACGGAPRTDYAADDSGKNSRDPSAAAVTPGDQAHAKTDLSITQSIRQAVVADTALSPNAHNVKIVTSDGVVTLRGPVANAAEKVAVGATAQRVAGVSRVDNQLELTN
jgi:osmotically-inducible protein OsmY